MLKRCTEGVILINCLTGQSKHNRPVVLEKGTGYAKPLFIMLTHENFQVMNRIISLLDIRKYQQNVFPLLSALLVFDVNLSIGDSNGST